MERELIVHDGSEPLKLDYVRVVCVSDTHCRLGDIKVPMGDILIHTGDFTLKGTFKEVKEFVKSLNKLPHLRKLVIGGNHDLCMDYTNVGLKEKFTEEYINKARSLVSASCIYLQDSGVQLFGYNIWGTPWIPKKNRAAFTLPRNSETLAARRSQIPVETDILMTHCPPKLYGDYSLKHQKNVGCAHVAKFITTARPKLCVFGHIHEAYSVSNGEGCTMVNAAICDTSFNPVHKPVVVDLPIPGPKAPFQIWR